MEAPVEDKVEIPPNLAEKVSNFLAVQDQGDEVVAFHLQQLQSALQPLYLSNVRQAAEIEEQILEDNLDYFNLLDPIFLARKNVGEGTFDGDVGYFE